MDDWMVALLVSGVVMLGGAVGVAGALLSGARRTRPTAGPECPDRIDLDADPLPR